MCWDFFVQGIYPRAEGLRLRALRGGKSVSSAVIRGAWAARCVLTFPCWSDEAEVLLLPLQRFLFLCTLYLRHLAPTEGCWCACCCLQGAKRTDTARGGAHGCCCSTVATATTTATTMLPLLLYNHLWQLSAACMFLRSVSLLVLSIGGIVSGRELCAYRAVPAGQVARAGVIPHQLLLLCGHVRGTSVHGFGLVSAGRVLQTTKRKQCAFWALLSVHDADSCSAVL